MVSHPVRCFQFQGGCNRWERAGIRRSRRCNRPTFSSHAIAALCMVCYNPKPTWLDAETTNSLQITKQ